MVVRQPELKLKSGAVSKSSNFAFLALMGRIPKSALAKP